MTKTMEGLASIPLCMLIGFLLGEALTGSGFIDKDDGGLGHDAAGNVKAPHFPSRDAS
jgi:hypothetical protein